MVRIVLGVLAGLVAWIVVATILNLGVRMAIPDYHAAEPTLAFTLAMKLSRLALALVASLAAGAVTRAIAPASRFAPWIVGLVLLVFFVPTHIQIGSRLPLWYHLFFLITLAPAVALGAWMLSSAGRAPRRRASRG